MISINKHTAVVGISSSGKTFLSKHIFFNLPSNIKAIFFNTNYEEFEEYPEIPIVTDCKLENLLNAKLAIEDVTEEKIIKYFEHAESLTATFPNDRETKFVFFIDEAQEFFPQINRVTELVKHFKKAYRNHITVFLISQRFQDIDKSVWSQIKQQIIFETTKVEEEYLLKKVAGLEEKHLIKEPFYFRVCTTNAIGKKQILIPE